MKRQYDVALPYNVPSMFIGMAISRLQEHDEWNGLPEELKYKIEQAQQGWDGCDLTQEDLDSIPDKLWRKIAVDLNIGWQDVKED